MNVFLNFSVSGEFFKTFTYHDFKILREGIREYKYIHIRIFIKKINFLSFRQFFHPKSTEKEVLLNLSKNFFLANFGKIFLNIPKMLQFYHF